MPGTGHAPHTCVCTRPSTPGRGTGITHTQQMQKQRLAQVRERPVFRVSLPVGSAPRRRPRSRTQTCMSREAEASTRERARERGARQDPTLCQGLSGAFATSPATPESLRPRTVFPHLGMSKLRLKMGGDSQLASVSSGTPASDDQSLPAPELSQVCPSFPPGESLGLPPPTRGR